MSQDLYKNKLNIKQGGVYVSITHIDIDILESVEKKHLLNVDAR